MIQRIAQIQRSSNCTNKKLQLPVFSVFYTQFYASDINATSTEQPKHSHWVSTARKN